MVGPQRGAGDRKLESERERERREIKTNRMVVGSLEGRRAGKLSSGNPCRSGMRSVE